MAFSARPTQVSAAATGFRVAPKQRRGALSLKSGRRAANRLRIAGPRILLIADVPDWIFTRHCRMLERYLSDEFTFSIRWVNDSYREADYDLIYPMEWNLVPRGQIGAPGKYVTGIRSQLSWQKEDFLPFVDFLATCYQRVHVVSRRLQRLFAPFLPDVLLLSHGVDTDFFTPSSAADRSGRGRLRIGWAGNRINATKGFERYIAPLAGIPGIELCYCGFQDRNLSLDEMRAFYDGVDAYVCASSSHHEGNNNSLMEAAAMGRAIVTTDNGAVPEYLHHGENALIVEREAPAFIAALVTLRDNPDLRILLGGAARDSVKKHFEWRDRAEDYRLFFREALSRRELFCPRFGAGRRAVARPEDVATGADPVEWGTGSPKRVGLFGASSRGIRYSGILAGNSRLQQVCFFDNDPAKWGTELVSMPVLSPDIGNLRSVDVILLASVWAREILEQLSALGLERRVAFDVPDLIHRFTPQSILNEEFAGSAAPKKMCCVSRTLIDDTRRCDHAYSCRYSRTK